MTKRRHQVRRASQRKSQWNTGHSKSYLKKSKTSKKKPKTPILTNRQKTKQALIKAGLHKSRLERKRQHAAMEKLMNYKIPKLSTTVGVKGKPGKASRYTVKKRIVDYKTEPVYEERRVKVYNRWGMPSYEIKKVKIGDRKIIIGEKIITKRLSKKGRGKGSSGGTDRSISHKTGTAQARKGTKRAARPTGKKGGKPKKEKRKTSKKS